MQESCVFLHCLGCGRGLLCEKLKERQITIFTFELIGQIGRKIIKKSNK